jgi:hypothetical protein
MNGWGPVILVMTVVAILCALAIKGGDLQFDETVYDKCQKYAARHDGSLNSGACNQLTRGERDDIRNMYRDKH